MTGLVTSIPLSSASADQLAQEMINRIKPFFPDWTDQLESNNMMVLIELLSMLMEMDYAYLGRMGRESFLQYALDPQNITAHAWGLGYTPEMQTPAVVSGVSFKSNQAVSVDTVMVAGSKISTLVSGIVYETTADVTFTAGSTTATGSATQWESQTKSFSGSGVASQAILLDQLPVIPSTITLTIDGLTWTKVETFLESKATDRHFMTKIMSDSSVYVICGDGTSGAVFADGASGIVKFKTGGGSAGTIGPYMLQRVTSEVKDAGTNAVLSISATNELASTPGLDRETPEQTRFRAKNNLRKIRTLMTLDDVESEVTRLSGVASARAVNWSIVPSLPHHVMQVYVAPDGLGTASQALLDAVTSAITVAKKLEMGTQLSVIGAKYRNLTWTITLYVKSGYTFSIVAAAIAEALDDLLNPSIPNIWGFTPAFGMSIYTSMIEAVLQQVDGVRNLVVSLPGDTTLAYNEFPKLSSVKVFGENSQSYEYSAATPPR